MSSKAAILWLAIVAAVLCGLLMWDYTPSVHEGRHVLLTLSGANSTITIPGESTLNFEAADHQYFEMMRDGPGEEPITSDPEVPPIDYSSDTYYVAHGSMEPGVWRVRYGDSVSILLSSPDQEAISITSNPSLEKLPLSIFWSVVVWVFIGLGLPFIFWLGKQD